MATVALTAVIVLAAAFVCLTRLALSLEARHAQERTREREAFFFQLQRLCDRIQEPQTAVAMSVAEQDQLGAKAFVTPDDDQEFHAYELERAG